jgi:hypothetical protein
MPLVQDQCSIIGNACGQEGLLEALLLSVSHEVLDEEGAYATLVPPAYSNAWQYSLTHVSLVGSMSE